MTRKKRPKPLIDVRKILETPVGRTTAGRSISPYEAAMRRSADKAASGNMTEARRFIRALIKCGLLQPVARDEEDHQYVLRIPKDWDDDEWMAMYNRYGPPPWPGEHNGLIPLERWLPVYGKRPRSRSRRAERPIG